MPAKNLVLRLKSPGPSVHQHIVIGRGLGLRAISLARRTCHDAIPAHDRASRRDWSRRRRSRSAQHAALFPGRLLIVAHGDLESRAPSAKAADPPTSPPSRLGVEIGPSADSQGDRRLSARQHVVAG